MKRRYVAVMAAVVLMLVGCATASRMNGLSVGMTKEQVVRVLGAPVSTAAPGQGTELLRYELAQPASIWTWPLPKDTAEYFVRLVDGRVASYGRMGDFNSTKDPTLNLNIRQR